jgi:uncharacterized protein (TIGR02594 family)
VDYKIIFCSEVYGDANAARSFEKSLGQAGLYMLSPITVSAKDGISWSDRRKLQSEVSFIQENLNGITPEDWTSLYSKSKETLWMGFAESQLGQKEMNPGDNPVIISYHATAGGFKNDETPWCSSFVNWSMTQSSIKGTNSARALSWKGWGQTLNDPAYGSIAVIDYGGGRGHVGFVAGMNSAGKIVLLGGNQSDMVKYSAFSATSISRFVYPSGYIPSYSLPLINIGGNSSFSSTR